MPLGKWRWGRVCVCVYICVWGRDKVAAALRNLKAVPICPLRPGLACSAAAAARADDADGNSKRKCTFHTQNPFPNQQQQQRDVEKDVGATTKKRQATTTAIDDDDDDGGDDD